VKTAAAKYLLRNNRTVGMFIPTDKPSALAYRHAGPGGDGIELQGRAALAKAKSLIPRLIKLKHVCGGWNCPRASR